MAIGGSYESEKERGSKKINCPKCESDKFTVIGRYSVTDHHQIDWGRSYLELKCEGCGHKWEEEED